ncbi:MAG TPA: hypothetical protein VK658_14590 [Chryseolinea sp.]|nr:hypothetical protein [Chryseolinea sp.]
MKTTSAFLFAFLASCQVFAQHSLEKLWLSDSTLNHPESALLDTKAKILYVSNIGPFDSQGTGSISKVGLDGKIIKNDWVTGLTATKGLGQYKDKLFAAENSAVVVIDITSGKILSRIPVDGSQMLNDITVDQKGVVYVSDSKTGKVHKIENGKPSLFMENMNNINGLLALGTDLYILAGTTIHKSDANKKLTTIAEGLEGGLDGIEMVAPNEFLVTGWEGTIYYVKSDGSKQSLLDTRTQKINAADLGYDPKTKTLYIPQMMSNSLCAYKLK